MARKYTRSQADEIRKEAENDIKYFLSLARETTNPERLKDIKESIRICREDINTAYENITENVTDDYD
jgi:hypothetical protein